MRVYALESDHLDSNPGSPMWPCEESFLCVSDSLSVNMQMNSISPGITKKSAKTHTQSYNSRIQNKEIPVMHETCNLGGKHEWARRNLIGRNQQENYWSRSVDPKHIWITGRLLISGYQNHITHTESESVYVMMEVWREARICIFFLFKKWFWWSTSLKNYCQGPELILVKTERKSWEVSHYRLHNHRNQRWH